MRYLVAFTVVLCAFFCANTATAGPTTDSIAFQGHLTDASGTSVPDGPKDLILSVWTDSIGGTMLHSETVAVTTSKGLFSTCLGCGSSTLMEVIQSGDLWLQTQISGQPPMTPRTRVRTVPRAVYANGVYGEATSGSAKAKGIISVKASVGSGTSSIVHLESDNNSDGTPEVSCSEVVSDKFAQVRGFKVDIDGARRSSFENYCDSGGSVTSCSRDNNGNGVDETRCELRANDSGSTLTMQDGEDGEDQGIVAMTGNKAMPRTEIVKKIWATGHKDGVIISAGDSPDGVIGEMAIDQGGNRRVSINGSAAGSAIELTEPLAGVGTTGSLDYTVRVRHANDDSIDELMSKDSDGDGIPECSDRRTVSANEFHHNSVSRSGSTTATIRQVATPDSAVTVLDHDSDGDGVPECSIGNVAQSSGALVRAESEYNLLKMESRMHSCPDSASVHCEADSDGDGVPEGEIESIVTPTVSSVAINQKGTGADKNRVITTATPDSVVEMLSSDHDGDGNPELYARRRMINADAKLKTIFAAVDPNDDGVPDVTMESDVSADSASLRLNGLPPGVPVTETIAMTVTPTSVHMEVGAATCDGTNWTNASDKNSKENFEQIDGAELLEQIEELPIAKWNYKQDDESVKHIGPTAQDFKEVFGVGANDKTISTIDPSGIALAAIKELYKQNQALEEQSQELLRQGREFANQNRDLHKQNENLKKQLEELTRKVEKLAKGK